MVYYTRPDPHDSFSSSLNCDNPTISSNMHFISNQHKSSAFALLALLSASAFATPITNPIEPSIQTRDASDMPSRLVYFSLSNYRGLFYSGEESSGRAGKGDCYSMGEGHNTARSAKAPKGYKCTIYSDKGCHGWRTKEFNYDGIADTGAKLNNNGESWRCCKIGTTNGWGYCDANLNGGS